MKKLTLLGSVLILTACVSDYKSDSMPPTPEPGEELVTEQNNDDLGLAPELVPDDDEANVSMEVEKQTSGGNEITLDNFDDRSVLESPIELTGTAPRRWFFEGSFPVTVLTLEDEIVKEWYAEGPWLEGVDGREAGDLSGDDMIPFSISTDYEPPAEGDRGKIRLAKNLVAEEDTEDLVEIMVLWP